MTAALAVAAVATGMSSNSRYDSLKSTCAQTPAGCTADQIGVVRSRDQTANVLWALAGVSAVGTGVTVFVNTREAGVSALWKF